MTNSIISNNVQHCPLSYCCAFRKVTNIRAGMGTVHYSMLAADSFLSSQVNERFELLQLIVYLI